MVARRISPPPTPQFFGRYRVVAPVGRGAMGIVYKAHDPLLDRNVALKVIKTDLLDADERSEYLGRFMREAQAAARCAHHGIIGVYDFSQNEGSPFIVMELVEAPDLRRVMRDSGALAPSQALPIMMQILDALDHAHGLGIVHRDIKPPNILVPRTGGVKITDFGIARLGGAQATQAGVMIGTPQYMAPEQARAEPVDMRADLFAAAAVFWEMLSGKPCFAGTTQVEILSQVIYGEPQAPAVASASSHSALFATLGRTLAKNPGERFGSAAEFAAALRHASTGNAPAATSFDDSFVDTSDADHTVVASTRSGLEAHVVEQAEKELATFIGPLAKVFVKKAAATAASPSDLYQSLAREIADESDRTRFLRHAVPPSPSAAPAPTLGGVSRSGVGTRPVATTGIPPVTAEAQAAAQTALTVFLGPIAKVLVRQAASQGGTAEEFFGRLIAHLTRDEDRAAFRRQLQKFHDPKF